MLVRQGVRSENHLLRLNYQKVKITQNNMPYFHLIWLQNSGFNH